MPFDINKAPDWAIDIYLNLSNTLTKGDVRKLLGVSERTLNRRMDDGSLVFIKTGTHRNSGVRFPKLAVVRYMVESSNE